MISYPFRMVARALFALLLGLAATTASAGPLNPPAGPITSTYKTPDQVEPRIPVSSQTTPGNASCLYLISQPGSYYLTGNISGEIGKHGIMITAHNVTLDLNGFTLTGRADALNGIHMSNRCNNVVIRNGTICRWGGNGISSRIDAGRIEGIIASENSGWGIENDGSNTSQTHIVGCDAHSNAEGGIRGYVNSYIADCTTRANGGFAIYVGNTSVVTRCKSRHDAAGIRAISSSVITHNHVSTTLGDEGHGILITGGGNRIEDNHVADCNNTGIRVDVGYNVIVRNTSRNNWPNYSLSGSQMAGPIISTMGTLTDVSPWANFSF